MAWLVDIIQPEVEGQGSDSLRVKARTIQLLRTWMHSRPGCNRSTDIISIVGTLDFSERR